MPTYEMFWDCDRCGTEKLLGKTHRHCPNCGAPQDPGRRYFPPEEEKVAVEDHKYVGADRRCVSCDTPNSAAAEFCTNCGNALEGAGSVSMKAEVEAGMQSGTRKPAKAPDPGPAKKPEASGGSGAGAAAAGMGLFGMGCLGLVAVVFVGFLIVCLLNLFWTESADLTVKGHTWTRSIELEKLSVSNESDWCNEMPANAKNVKRTEKKKSSKKVKDGEDCKTKNVDQGDGTFKTKKECTPRYREEPVMAAWCSWEAEKWKTFDTKKSTGTGLDSKPEWPKVSVDTCQTLGCSRQGEKKEVYTVELAEADGSKHTCDLKEPKWRTMAVGSKWTGTKAVLTGGLKCTDLEPAK
ncbi:MAG: zinc ribbon domain-containing protein [Alphaproteobacteria bacterium]|nr:zinc ribbon domain-containing protein [Alphaproteobacteria bacterium]